MGMDTSTIPQSVKVDDDTINENAQGEIELNENYSVPVGCILAWAKDIETLEIPDGFVECNGQTIDDEESPLDNVTIPDLNGDNSFLRGNSTSGGTGGNATHTHSVSAGSGSNKVESSTGDINEASSLPPYYNIVWIMRIK
jgi:hypothetical protein